MENDRLLRPNEPEYFKYTRERNISWKKKKKEVRSMSGEYAFMYLFTCYNKLYLLRAYCVANHGEVRHMQGLINSIHPLKETMTENIPSLQRRNVRQNEVLGCGLRSGKMAELGFWCESSALTLGLWICTHLEVVKLWGRWMLFLLLFSKTFMEQLNHLKGVRSKYKGVLSLTKRFETACQRENPN